jgi:hypothetical protein
MRQVHFLRKRYLLISTRTEIFNKGAISLEDRFSLGMQSPSHWELMTNELLLSFQEFFICVLKASLKTLQESFPVIFLLIVDMTDLRLYFYHPFFQVILDKSQQFILLFRLIAETANSTFLYQHPVKAVRFSLSLFRVHFQVP